MGYNIAIVGATGIVGRSIISILSEHNIEVQKLDALASKESVGKSVSFGDQSISIQDINEYDFTNADIALFAAGSGISECFIPKATKLGCVVIDNSSFFRMHEDIPLIIPEINSDQIKNYTKQNIIANPNCSTIQLLIVLHPLHKIARIKRVVVSTYQSVSGAGKPAMDELYNQTKNIFMNKKISPEVFSKQIAFNCIPHIDEFLDDGSTKEEWKIQAETQKILDPSIALTATCVRVPVFVGHSESVNIEFYDTISVEQVYDALSEAEGVLILDRQENGGYITPLEVVQEDVVYVSRIRKDNSLNNAINLWISADNVRKGAALNAVQILEHLIQEL